MTRHWLKLAALTSAVSAMWFSSAHAQGKLDHLFCYRVEDPLAIRTTVDMLADLQPEFTQKGCRLLKPIEFCVPATKANVRPLPPNPRIVGQPLQDDYICYLAECRDRTRPADKLVADQFGRRIDRKFRPTKVCVPARKRPVPCGASGRQCGGICPNPDDDCRVSPVDAGCACVPRACGGHVDSAGSCGGSCTDATERCLPNADGVCTCQPPPPPPCGLNPDDGVCGGTCPNPGDQCLISPTGGGCSCQSPPPPPCGGPAGTTQCKGACPDGVSQCVTDPAGNCICQPLPPSCGLVPGSNQCGGPCPNAADQCVRTAAGCACEPPASTCSRIPGTTQCGGDCTDPTTKCGRNADGDCACVPNTTPCGLTPGTSNQCGGNCPAGQTCRLCTNPAACPLPCSCQ